ncbi:bifunctional cobalt-precorrin-7 [Sesbania bispinosa]|nr:bifunctional cobalt-precorrin-7 [Sesbania bispinosa]
MCNCSSDGGHTVAGWDTCNNGGGVAITWERRRSSARAVAVEIRDKGGERKGVGLPREVKMKGKGTGLRLIDKTTTVLNIIVIVLFFNDGRIKDRLRNCLTNLKNAIASQTMAVPI